jgi:hypothetical protein
MKLNAHWLCAVLRLMKPTSLLESLSLIGNEVSKYLDRTAGQTIYHQELGLWNAVLATSTMARRGCHVGHILEPRVYIIDPLCR